MHHLKIHFLSFSLLFWGNMDSCPCCPQVDSLPLLPPKKLKHLCNISTNRLSQDNHSIRALRTLKEEQVKETIPQQLN